MRYYLVFILLFFTVSVFSQNNASLISADGKPFKVLVGGKVVNAIPQAHVTLEKIMKDTLALELEFENKKKLPAIIYLLEKGMPCKGKEFNYKVNFDMTSLKLQFLGIYDINPLPDPLVPKMPVTDTSEKYRNKLLGHFCELKDGKPVYFNNLPKEGSCVTSMPAEYLNYTAILMSRTTIQDVKYTIVENVCRNNCMSAEQLGKLLKYIDYEIEKLKLIRIAYFNLTDPANQNQLEKSFRFESSIKELHDFFKNSNDYKLKKENNCERAASQMIIDNYAERLAACSNDSERFDAFKRGYSHLCYSIDHVALILGKFIHDREKLEVAKLLYFNCVEKEKFTTIYYIFSYNQTISELKDFIDKQRN